MTTSNNIYSQVEGMQVHETDDGLVVFNPDTDQVHHLNFTAGAIYTLCESAPSGADNWAVRRTATATMVVIAYTPLR